MAGINTITKDLGSSSFAKDNGGIIGPSQVTRFAEDQSATTTQFNSSGTFQAGQASNTANILIVAGGGGGGGGTDNNRQGGG